VTEIEESKELSELSAELEADLMRFYGSPLLSGENLKGALGYRSIDALRQAIIRKTIPVPVFQIKNRRGKYALIKDIAHYLAKTRLSIESFK